MKAIDLREALKDYKKGWIALDTKKKYKVIAHSDNFGSITKKIKGRKDILLIPASSNYFGFVT